MGGKPKFKDWKPGEYRFDIKVVTPSGSQFELYISRVSEDEGTALALHAIDVLHGMPERLDIW